MPAGLQTATKLGIYSTVNLSIATKKNNWLHWNNLTFQFLKLFNLSYVVWYISGEVCWEKSLIHLIIVIKWKSSSIVLTWYCILNNVSVLRPSSGYLPGERLYWSTETKHRVREVFLFIKVRPWSAQQSCLYRCAAVLLFSRPNYHDKNMYHQKIITQFLCERIMCNCH